jgi:hypothetical protein
MGFFAKPAGLTGGLDRLSNDRIKASLERQNWSYGVDEDGDVGGGWTEGSFYFLLRGKSEEILHVRGHWRGILPDSEFTAAVAACNEWNASRIWPKTYAMRMDDAETHANVHVYTEHNVDYEHGVSDEQLDQHLMCSIETSGQFFDYINELYPAVWEQYRPRDDD